MAKTKKPRRLKHLKWNSSLAAVGSAIAGEFGEAKRRLSPRKRKARAGSARRPSLARYGHTGPEWKTYRGYGIKIHGGRAHWSVQIVSNYRQLGGGRGKGVVATGTVEQTFRGRDRLELLGRAKRTIDAMHGDRRRLRSGRVAIASNRTGYLTGRQRRANVPVGGRVELSPSTDAWMMGDRFGVITGVTKTGLVKVKMDRSGKVRKLRRKDLTPAARGQARRR